MFRLLSKNIQSDFRFLFSILILNEKISFSDFRYNIQLLKHVFGVEFLFFFRKNRNPLSLTTRLKFKEILTNYIYSLIHYE